MVLLYIGAVHCLLQPLTPGLYGPHLDLSAPDSDGTPRLLDERPIPTSLLQAPRPHEHATFHNHSPDADEAVWLRAGPNTDDFTVMDGGQNISGETSLLVHTGIFAMIAPVPRKSSQDPALGYKR